MQVQKTLSDHAILQQGIEIPIKGWAKPNSKVWLGGLSGNKIYAEVDSDGRWVAVIPKMQAGGPHTLSVHVDERAQLFKDIYFGDVWLCSGQSNMEWVLRNTANVEEEIANAKDQLIRQFKVPHDNADKPQDALPGGDWVSASPATVGDFTAVGYYFAKSIRANHDIPIGLLNSSWGGSRIEPWISKVTLDSKHPDYSYDVFVKKNNIDLKGQEEKLKKMFPGLTDADIGIQDGKPLWAGEVDEDKWKKISIEELWENQGMEGADGVAYYRTVFELNEQQAADDIIISLGAIDDDDITWLNGQEIGETAGYNLERTYKVSSNILKVGENVLLVRAYDGGGGGGIYSANFNQQIETSSGNIDLKRLDWKIRFSAIQINTLSNQIPNLIYNAMINPIVDFPVKGVIWYQGESNAGDLKTAYDYRFHLKTLIEEWRAKWQQAEMPFYFVQLANWQQPKPEPTNDGWAVIRESMNEVLKVKNTGQAVIIDIGEANDIHPRNKKDVGERLALHARTMVYGEDLTFASPMYESHKIEKGKVILSFANTPQGLMAKNKYGYVNGFSIAGEDKKFHWAQARIKDGRVEVWSDQVPDPIAVRYAWEINPGDVNLYSKEGLPVTPFRTDDWNIIE